ncbi:head-tail connector protein [Butyrivibrio sp. AD3002]|uniref:head-tail connector protein n=1 Tax=Butyrivibrio sp. AD3002 TaxID=1280670 RepID=UPI0003B609D2|nr:head-tail connector protein [Butyrivibrio sp. AD3002]
MDINLEEVKTYLRVDHGDEDELIGGLIESAKEMVLDVIRTEEVPESGNGTVRTAVLYTVAYLYEHREEADHHDLMLSLRSLLMGVRKAGF